MTLNPISFEKWLEANFDLANEANPCTDCTDCKGEKSVICRLCDGEGEQYDEDVLRLCRRCDGNGCHDCYLCNGTGTSLHDLYLQFVRRDTQLLHRAVQP